jgi:hypothetical protein
MDDDISHLFMDDEVRAFGAELGTRALAREWSRVRELLAPWMQAQFTTDDVQAFFEDEYRDVLAEVEIEELHHPEYPEPELGGNSHTKATQLRQPPSWDADSVRPIPPELTDDKVRWWLSMQLQCSDDQMDELGLDYLCETWMAVVDTDDGLRVGYWNQRPY